MATPNYAVGYGNISIARNVFGLNIKRDLSSLVVYKCFDNDQTFPELEDPPLETANNIVLLGTAGQTPTANVSMIGLVDTSNAAPASDWMPTNETGGSANPNLMNGGTSYVTQEGSIATADVDDDNYNTVPPITFNMVANIPNDVETTDPMGFEVQITYTYTGVDPEPKFQFNDYGDGAGDGVTGGDEADPYWTDIIAQIAAGGEGILHTRDGATVGALYANIPSTGSEATEMGWVTEAPA